MAIYISKKRIIIYEKTTLVAVVFNGNIFYPMGRRQNRGYCFVNSCLPRFAYICRRTDAVQNRADITSGRD